MRSIEKRYYIESLKGSYRRGSKKRKGEILDELESRLSISRRQARRLMSKKPRGRPKNPNRAGNPGKYCDAEFVRALKEVWQYMRQMCSKNMDSSLSVWLPAIEEERGKAFSEDIRKRLFKISPSSIDRLLKPMKSGKGKSLTNPGFFREQIPIQAESVWQQSVPGYLEADTVAHCGSSTHGEFVNTLVMVDIATLWTEARAVFGKGSTPIVLAIEDIERLLPFKIKGYDSDNGTEVLNQHVLRYFRDERLERNLPPVQITRSRPYKKNDNAHVEQRNNSLARKYLGYERIEFREILPLIEYYYREVVCPLVNHFIPTHKLKEKMRIKSRTKRIYDKPKTPYQRVMESEHVSDLEKQILKRKHESLNPVKLSKLEIKIRKQIDKALKALKSGRVSQGLLKVPEKPAVANYNSEDTTKEVPRSAELNIGKNNVRKLRVSNKDKLPLYKTGT